MELSIACFGLEPVEWGNMQDIRAHDNVCYLCFGSQRVGRNAFEYDVDGSDLHCGADHIFLLTILGRAVHYNPVTLILPILFLL